MVTPQDVLQFWFKELEPKDWFIQSDAVDETVRSRFGATWQSVQQLRWWGGARARLAHLIVADQFPRNMFRGDAQAFSTDGFALALALQMVSRGDDLILSDAERPFVYLPFQHSESLQWQERGVALTLTRLPGATDTLLHARAHRDIVRAHGRFPHRDAVLGRRPSAAGQAYLDAGGYGAVVAGLRAPSG